MGKGNNPICLEHSLVVRVCAIIVFWVNGLFVYAEAPTLHYIIAFDQAPGNYKAIYSSRELLTQLESVLECNGFDGNRDFVSIVGYTMEMGNPSVDRFVRGYTDDGGEKMIWRRIGDKSLSNYFRNWPQGEPTLNRESFPIASMQSMAKPFAVMETKARSDSSAMVDKTILLLVTDEVVNGIDDNYRLEWNNAATSTGANFQKFQTLSSDVFGMMRDFNQRYKFDEIKLNQQKGIRIPISSDGVYKIIPYEVLPTEVPSIFSVTDMPSPLPLQRVRGGYKLDMNVKSINPDYSLQSIRLLSKDGKVLGESKIGEMEMVIPGKKIHEGDTIEISMSLLLKDGLYDGSRISEANERYAKGMTTKQRVRIQDEAKVLGLLPLNDYFWWWFPNDIFTAVMIWDLVILLALIIIVGYVLYRLFVRINMYTPGNDKLKIKKI